jgi:gliding motility-associated-like protein
LRLQPESAFNNYLWSTGESQSQVIITSPGRYWLEVTDVNNCTGRDTITVYPKECISGVYIPTAFTPNGDGKNDYFRARIYGKTVLFKLQVFNRFGQIVFETTDPYKSWDGLIKGESYSATVFVWQCSYQLENQKPVHKKGMVTLIR